MNELTERQHQCKFFKWARENYPITRLMYANNNGGYRRKREATHLKYSGATKGVPDIHLPYPAGGYYGLFIELKKDDNSRRSPEQVIWMEELTALGFKAVFACGWLEARDILIDYLGDII